MPKRDQLFQEMQGENRQAALLIAQVGALPTELQLVLQVADYDAKVGGLRPLRSYIIRVLGVLEHRVVNLGTTVHDLKLETQHPLLYEYVEKPAAVFFRGMPQNIDTLVLDIAQAHASTFLGWRHFPVYLNTEQPLATLFASGGGLVGQMPSPLADRIVKVLEKHGLEHKVMVGEPHAKPPMPDQQLAVLIVGESYFVSFAFSVDEMGKV